jgi:hypothetical protein
LRGLADKYASRADVAIVIVYQREPHAGRMAFAALAQPATFAERRALATRAKDELGLPLLSLVDGMDDASRALFSDLPAPVFALDRFGHVAAKEPWIDVDKLPAMLDAALVARPPAGSTRSAFAEALAGAAAAAASRPTTSRPAAGGPAAPPVGDAARALRDDPTATDDDRAKAALALAATSADGKDVDAALRAASRVFGTRPLRHAAALTRAAEACEAAARRDAAARFRRAALEAAAGRVDAAVEARLKALAGAGESADRAAPSR